jgi:hypothetical protein
MDRDLVTVFWTEEVKVKETGGSVERFGNHIGESVGSPFKDEEGKKTYQRYKYALPEPAGYSSTVSTMVDSGTSVSGKVLGSVIRENVAQISMSWNYLSAEQWKQINDLFKERYETNVCFYDQTTGAWTPEWTNVEFPKMREMTVSDRSAGMWRRDSLGNVLGWTGCSIQLTEV